MRIPLDWLKMYVETNDKPKDIADSFTSLGLMLDKILPNNVLDLEHRMDRADWLSIIGCARDFAAFENKPLKFPELHSEDGKVPTSEQIVDIKVECPEIVNRFNTKVFRGVKVGPSPSWLKESLEQYGIPSINNIVDITNFVMVEIGQPMHAQDLEKMEKKEIVIRRAKQGEELTTLLGETVKLDPECFVLTQNGKATVLGGIVGSKATAVDEKTTDIILDAGNYDQVNIRKNSRKLKIQNETVLRYDKFLHPKLTEIALARATKLILDLAGGEYYENIDYYPKVWPLKKMKLRRERVEKLSGLDISMKKIKDILTSLNYVILKESEKEIFVEVPYFRTDIEVEDDLVSDILRIGDYKNIPSSLMNMAPPQENTPAIYKFENVLRDTMVNIGFHEHITNPLVQTNLENQEQVTLQNSLTSDKTALRTDIYETLSQVVTTYRKNKIKVIPLFEIGLVYSLNGNKDNYSSYKETRVLQIIYENDGIPLIERIKKLKRSLNTFINNLGIKGLLFEKESEYTVIKKDKTIIGRMRHNSVSFETEKLLELATIPNNNRVITNTQNLREEDISLVLDINQELGPIYNEINGYSEEILGVEVLEEYLDKKLGDDKKSVLIRIIYMGDLSNKKQNLINTLKNKFKAEVRS